MSNHKRNSQGKHVNTMDEFLTRDQENEISRQVSVQQQVFDINADDLAHQPASTSQEHSLDDTHETLTQPCFDKNALLEAAEDAMKNDEQE